MPSPGTRAVLLLGLLGALALRWPAVPGGYQDDDYIQAAMLDGEFWIDRNPLDLFWFSGRDAVEQRALIEHGYLPWWTHPEHRVAMLRPFASGLLALEHALGLSPQAQHASALLCFALCLWAAYRFLSGLLPERVAVVATLVYALDEAHSAPTSWLANRSTLISTAIALVACASYVRARTQAPERPVPPARTFVLLLLAFLSGEYGYFALGYVAAFELVGVPKRSPGSALITLSLAGLVSVGGALLGYGVAYSGYYISPFADSVRFACAAVARLPALLIDIVAGVPAAYVDMGWPLRELVLERNIIDPITWFNLPSYRSVAGVLVVLVLLGLYFGVRSLVRRDPSLASLRFLVLGACLALLPAAGAVPSSRLTGGSAVGFAALIAVLVVRAFQLMSRQLDTAASPMRRVGAAAVLLALAFVHGLLPADRAYAEARNATARSRIARNWVLGADIPSALPANAQVWITSASDFTTAAHVPWVRRHAGRQLVPTLHLLSGAPRAHDLFRIDDRTLELQVLASDPGHGFSGSLHRPVETPLRDGDRVELPGFSVHVIATIDGDPVRFRITADRSLDDPSLVLLCPEPSGLRRCAAPQLGMVLRLPRAPVPWGNPQMSFAKTLRPL